MRPRSSAGPSLLPSPLMCPRTHRAVGVMVLAVAVTAASLTSCMSEGGTDDAASSTTAGEGTPVLVPVATLDEPTAMAVRPGSNDLFVAERAGTVRVIERDAATTTDPEAHRLVDEPVVDISDTVETASGGLVGLTFSPSGDELFLGFTGPTPDNADITLDRFAVADDGSIDPATRENVITVERQEIDLEALGLDPDEPPSNHIGGDVHFGPDGLLYFSVGDGGPPIGQNTSLLFGKLLRIDPTGSDPAHPGYAVPADNPFVGDPAVAPEIWSYGLRNPFRFSFDSETGDLWLIDVGEATFEEVNLLRAEDGGGASANLGWARFEGTMQMGEEPPPPDALDPTYEYGHGPGRCSITGGVAYRGDELPELQGRYLFSDLCERSILALDVESGDDPVESTVLSVGEDDAIPQFVGFAEDAEGEVYVMALGPGTIFRLAAG